MGRDLRSAPAFAGDVWSAALWLIFGNGVMHVTPLAGESTYQKIIRTNTGRERMTETIDKMLVKTGFDEQELREAKTRAWLYFGIAMMLMTSLIFFGMLAFSY